MILASAQTLPYDEDVDQNLEAHYKFIKKAADAGAKLIVFPEMSLTGYLRDAARNINFVPDDQRLEKLRSLSVKENIIIIAGAPLKVDSKLYISSFILSPDGSASIYTKHFLYTGEPDVFVPGLDKDPLISIHDETISFAICADIEKPEHAENARKRNTTIFIASIFYSKKGIAGGHDILRKYAVEHKMNVLMSNYVGKSWELDSGGMSAFWDMNGNKICELDQNNEGLLLVKKENNIWAPLNIN